jgi:prepilin-type N-terminal cleavage/methylation domain-containing protein
MCNIKNKGFTLVEIVVVVAIIGVLSSFIMANVSKSRAKGRDLQRMTDLKRLQVALRSYYLDKGFYPSTGATANVYSANLACFTCSAGKDRQLKNPYNTSTDLGTLTTVLSPYIQQLIDPQENDSQWSALPWRGFVYASDGSSYKIIDNRTPENLLNYPTGMVDPTRCGGVDSSTGLCNANGTQAVAVQTVGLWSSDAAKVW